MYKIPSFSFCIFANTACCLTRFDFCITSIFQAFNACNIKLILWKMKNIFAVWGELWETSFPPKFKYFKNIKVSHDHLKIKERKRTWLRIMIHKKSADWKQCWEPCKQISFVCQREEENQIVSNAAKHLLLFYVAHVCFRYFFLCILRLAFVCTINSRINQIYQKHTIRNISLGA